MLSIGRIVVSEKTENKIGMEMPPFSGWLK
jgi:hypothetical protein